MFLEGSSLSKGNEIVECDVIYEIFVAKFMILTNLREPWRCYLP
jgi:hypothetical protein